MSRVIGIIALLTAGVSWLRARVTMSARCLSSTF